MGFMDEAKAKLSSTDQIKQRMEELKAKAKDNNLDDRGREELNKLRAQLGHK